MRALKTATPRERAFAAIAGLVYLGALIAALGMAVLVDETADEPTVWTGLMLVLLGAPFVVGALSLVMFGARFRTQQLLATVGLGVFALGTVGAFFVYIPATIQGARWILRGSERGTVAQIATSRASWVEVTPAIADTDQIGEGEVNSYDVRIRYTRTYRRYAAPISAPTGTAEAAGADAPVTLFLCARDRDDLLAQARGGTIRGRMAAPELADGRAIESLRDRVRIAPNPRCVRATLGGGASTGLGWLVVSVAMMLGAAWFATTGALRLTRSARARERAAST